VEAFAAHLLESEPELNIIIQNAAQTIQRAPGFYREPAAQEERPDKTLSLPAQRLVAQPTEALRGSLTAALPDNTAPTLADVLPLAGMHDWEERVDHRNINSWLLPIKRWRGSSRATRRPTTRTPTWPRRR
jgi:hypothetical protein